MTSTGSRAGSLLLVLLSAGCVAHASPAADTSGHERTQVARSVSANCPVLRADVTAGSSTGEPGSVIHVSGPLYYLDKAGEVWVDADDTVQAWWNVEPEEYASVALAAIAAANGSDPGLSGDELLVGADRTERACSFHLLVTVPQVPPGTYPVTVLRVGGSDDSASAYGWFRYTVT